MISRTIDTWNAWPVWAKWTSGIGAVVLIEAVSVASRERNFLAALVEHSVALVLRYGILAAAVGGAVWIGAKIHKRTPWAGWVVGIGLFFLIGVGGMSVATSLPGVGWRVAAMADSDCRTEWDGRSNPTVCD